MPEPALWNQHRLFLRRVGVTLLALSAFYAYGAAKGIIDRMYLRTNGVPTLATVIKLEPRAGRTYTLLSFKTPDGEEQVHRAMDGYLGATAPVVDSQVPIRYDPNHPDLVHIKLDRGILQYQWLVTPGLLAFMFLLLLLLGVRFVLA